MLSFTLNDGNTIPWVAFGTGTALFGQDAAKSVTVAINNGMTHLDGAQVYRNEQSLGDGIKGMSSIGQHAIHYLTRRERSIQEIPLGPLHHHKTEGGRN